MKNKLLLIIRKAAYRLILLVENIVPVTPPDYVIFCFHSVADDNWLFGVSQADFDYYLAYLTSRYQAATIDEFSRYLAAPTHSSKPKFLLTFDDGYADILSAVKLCQKYQIKPVLFVLSNPSEANREELANTKQLLTVGQIKHLHQLGWAIGSHSATHADLTRLSLSELKSEIVNSRKVLEEKLDFAVPYFSYPKGRYNKQVLTLVKESGYQLAFSMDELVIGKTINRYAIPRIGVVRTFDRTEFKASALATSIRTRNFVIGTLGISS